jgi:hypothetical protein
MIEAAVETKERVCVTSIRNPSGDITARFEFLRHGAEANIQNISPITNPLVDAIPGFATGVGLMNRRV